MAIIDDLAQTDVGNTATDVGEFTEQVPGIGSFMPSSYLKNYMRGREADRLSSQAKYGGMSQTLQRRKLIEESAEDVEDIYATERERLQQERELMDEEFEDLIGETRRRRRAFETGSAFDMALDEARESRARTQRQIGMAGGSPADTMQALALSEGAGQDAMNRLFEGSFAQQGRLTDQIAGLTQARAGMRGGITGQMVGLGQNEATAEERRRQMLDEVLGRQQQRELELTLADVYRLRGEQAAEEKKRTEQINEILGLASTAATGGATGAAGAVTG